MVIISKLWPKAGLEQSKGVEVEASMFKVQPGFAFGATVICIALIAIYSAWW
jgi:SSS family solute:Na+ symporter